MSFVCEEVRKWERQGIVSFVDRKHAAVSPLTVVTKNNLDGSVKRRLCVGMGPDSSIPCSRQIK